MQRLASSLRLAGYHPLRPAPLLSWAIFSMGCSHGTAPFHSGGPPERAWDAVAVATCASGWGVHTDERYARPAAFFSCCVRRDSGAVAQRCSSGVGLGPALHHLNAACSRLLTPLAKPSLPCCLPEPHPGCLSAAQFCVQDNRGRIQETPSGHAPGTLPPDISTRHIHQAHPPHCGSFPPLTPQRTCPATYFYA